MTYEVSLQVFSALAAFIAAVFWFLSARVKLPDFLDSPMIELTKPFRTASKLNAYAAVSAGISALAQVFLTIFFA